MMKGIKYACFSVLSLALLSACSMNQSSESSMDNQPTMNTTTNLIGCCFHCWVIVHTTLTGGIHGTS